MAAPDERAAPVQAKPFAVAVAAYNLRGDVNTLTVRARRERFSALRVSRTNLVSMAFLYGRAGRLTALFGGFRLRKKENEAQRKEIAKLKATLARQLLREKEKESALRTPAVRSKPTASLGASQQKIVVPAAGHQQVKDASFTGSSRPSLEPSTSQVEEATRRCRRRST